MECQGRRRLQDLLSARAAVPAVRALPRATLRAWLDDNPVVSLGGATDKIFDLTEEMGTEAVVALCSQPPPAAAAPREGGETSPLVAPPPDGFEWGATF